MKTLPFYIAKRYLFSKKSHNAINIISAISLGGVTVGTMALIVVLSIFNGFDSLIKSMFNSFDPDLKITLVEGKVFSTENEAFQTIKKMPEIAFYIESLEEAVLLEYADKQHIGIIKGVDAGYSKMNRIDTMMMNGDFLLHYNKEDFAVVGYGVAYYLSLGLNFVNPIKIWTPRRTAKPTFDPQKAFNRKTIFPIGVFSVQPEFDAKYVITPIDFARELLEYDDEVGMVEIKIKQIYNKEKVQQKIQAILGDKFRVKNRYEQHELFYKIMKSEKWAIFLILSFILVIASFNVLSSITMLILEKKKDIAILQSMGANKKLIRRIFIAEGWLISIIGAILGLILGVFVSFMQQEFGIVGFPGEASFVIDSYPVEIQLADIFYVFTVVICIGFVAAWYPINIFIKKNKQIII